MGYLLVIGFVLMAAVALKQRTANEALREYEARCRRELHLPPPNW